MNVKRDWMINFEKSMVDNYFNCYNLYILCKTYPISILCVHREYERKMNNYRWKIQKQYSSFYKVDFLYFTSINGIKNRFLTSD